MVELRLPDNLFSNNEPRRRISKVEMETSKLRVSMENTPIAQLPLDTTVDQSLMKYNLSTAELGVYPFVVVGNENRIYPDVTDEEAVSSFALYKQHKTNFILRACTDVGNETFVTFAQYQTTAYASDFPKTSPYYQVLKKNQVFQAVTPGFALSFPDAKVENGKLYIHDVRELEKAIASALEYAVTYACTQDNEDMYVDFVTEAQASEAGVDIDTASSVYVDSLSQTVYFWKYWLGGDSGATASLIAGFKPTVQITGQSLTIKYDTAGFTNVVPVLFNSEYIQTYDYPFQMNIDLFRQSLWYKPPPKRMYKYGVGTDGDPPAYDYRLLLDMQAAVFNIIGNKAMRDSLSFLPWKKVNLSQIDVPQSSRFLVEVSKQSSYNTMVPTINRYVSDRDCAIETRAAYGFNYPAGTPESPYFSLPLESGKASNVWVGIAIHIKESYMNSLIAQYSEQYTEFDTTSPSTTGYFSGDDVRLTAAFRAAWPDILNGDPENIRVPELRYQSNYVTSSMGKTIDCNSSTQEMSGMTGPTIIESFTTTEQLSPGTEVIGEYAESKTLPESREVIDSTVKSMMALSLADNVWVGDFSNGQTSVESLHYEWYSVVPNSSAISPASHYGKGLPRLPPFSCKDQGIPPTIGGDMHTIDVRFLLNMSETDEGAYASTPNMKIGEITFNNVQLVHIREEAITDETTTITRTVTTDGTAPSIEYIPNLSIDAQKDDFYILDANTADLTIGQPEVTNNGPVVNTEHKFKIVEEVIEEVVGKTAHDEYLGTWGTGHYMATGSQPKWQMHLDPHRESDLRFYPDRVVWNESAELTEHRYYFVNPDTDLVDYDHLLCAEIDFHDAFDGTRLLGITAVPPNNTEAPYAFGIWSEQIGLMGHTLLPPGHYYVTGVPETPQIYKQDALMYDTPSNSVPFDPSRTVSTTVTYSDSDEEVPGVTSTITTNEITQTTVKSTSEVTPIWNFVEAPFYDHDEHRVNGPYVESTETTPYIPGVDHGAMCVYKHDIGAWHNVELRYEHFHVYDVDNATFEKYWVPVSKTRYESYWSRFSGLPENWTKMMNRPSWAHYLTQLRYPGFAPHLKAVDGRTCQTERISIRDNETGREYQMLHVWYDLFIGGFVEKIQNPMTQAITTNVIIPDSGQPMNYHNPGFDHLCLINPDTYIQTNYPNNPDPNNTSRINGYYKIVEQAVSTVRTTRVRTVIDIRPQLAGNVQLTYTWNELPMVVMSPIASIILTLDGINFTSEIQPYNMTTPGAGSSLTQTIPVAENYYSLAQTLRDLHDELVVTRADFDSNAKYTLERNCGDERTIRLTAHYLSKDGTLHKIYIPPNGVFAIQLTFRISYYYI